MPSTDVNYLASSMPNAGPPKALPKARIPLDSKLQKQAHDLDKDDALQHLQDEFHIPMSSVYLCGNSLGLQPRRTAGALSRHLEKWATSGVDGHFTAPQPWASIEDEASQLCMPLVGAAHAHEVAVMNSLTVNMHLLLTALYRPTGKRVKIVVEEHAFSSDEYALQTHVRTRGIDPHGAIERLAPRPGETLLRHHDIDHAIRRLHAAGELALVFLPGVQFYTGQVFPMQRVAALCRSLDVPLGLDLAHAVANVPLRLHEWGVDFAVWCSYKYLNAGPGAIGGAFLHDRHARSDLPRLGGWWGHERDTRFKMDRDFHPQLGIRGFQVSNPPVLALVPVTEALKLVQQAGGMAALREKSTALTGFLHDALTRLLPDQVDVISPHDAAWRGCQLSVRLRRAGLSVGIVNQRLHALGLVCDVREPDVIRVAPCPLYNSFADVCAFVCALKGVLSGAM